ncbi:hypothetical protein N7539_001980 [Penicillium diatomitis]|uniref:Uncharacterized protein n=1 Tax=Penicillium diatomitis TaxID=2819901 RepID=A0A9W9XIZ3_9EURO|nr:uncharacterized protein N7539_001980 [Penicillium diatomitis]KAJ5493234.1 hypothetical protein N7539_001980 [Penicillium diatomitis]
MWNREQLENFLREDVHKEVLVWSRTNDADEVIDATRKFNTLMAEAAKEVPIGGSSLSRAVEGPDDSAVLARAWSTKVGCPELRSSRPWLYGASFAKGSSMPLKGPLFNEGFVPLNVFRDLIESRNAHATGLVSLLCALSSRLRATSVGIMNIDMKNEFQVYEEMIDEKAGLQT